MGPEGDPGDRRCTHAQYALSWIRDAIVDGALEEGQELSQVQLSREIGVSRTPLREAIRGLEAEGWLASEPNGGVRVARVSLGELEQLYAMRVTLESLALTLATPRLTSAELETAGEVLDQADDALQRSDYGEWERLNQDFHSVLLAPAGHAIVQNCRALIAACFRYRKVYVLARPAAFVQAETDHRTILQSCELRDAPGAALALARHLARTALTLLAAADPLYDPVGIRAAMAMVPSRPSAELGV
ncbi:MAG TPA: GntR family transcriptional regulator [Gaiellaceae bacterium]